MRVNNRNKHCNKHYVGNLAHNRPGLIHHTLVIGGERFYPQQRCFKVFKYVIGSIGQKVNNWAQNIANTIDHTRGNFLLVLATVTIRRLGGRLPVNTNRCIGTGLVILTIANLVLDHAGTVSIRDIVVFKIYNR